MDNAVPLNFCGLLNSFPRGLVQMRPVYQHRRVTWLDVVGAHLRHRDTPLETANVVVDEVSHDHQLNKLHDHHPIAHISLDGVAWIRQLAERRGPKEEGDQLCQKLRCQEMGSEGLCSPLLHEHEKLWEHCDGLEIERESPCHIRRQKVVQVRVQDERHEQRGYDDHQVTESVCVRIIRASETNSAAVDHRPGEAQGNRFTQLVEPITRLVKWQVALKRDDRQQTSEEDENVTLHHLQ
mmetsp:Transcript_11222/g.31087  ORF Transcript_11222/g.31087 Transcript_11222/m.31087 type:complete len:238 (+) Transcript_11222:224-937(+)